jgi:putative toxin-antitoxin system antitoxin component (TIGR02293 family)
MCWKKCWKKLGNNTTKWMQVIQNVVSWWKELNMGKAIKKVKPYPIHEEEETLSYAEEAAVQYETMRVILGGNRSLGKAIGGELDLINLSRNGVRKLSLRSLSSYLGITMDKMSNLIHTSHRNIQRKDEDELLDSLKTEKVLELAAFVKRGMDVTGSKESFIEWLHTPLTSLGNKMPVDFLDTTFGIQLVQKVLGRLEQGVYS